MAQFPTITNEQSQQLLSSPFKNSRQFANEPGGESSAEEETVSGRHKYTTPQMLLYSTPDIVAREDDFKLNLLFKDIGIHVSD